MVDFFDVSPKNDRASLKREFLQIGNVDVSMNVNVDSHPVGSSTSQNCQIQGKE